MLTANLYFPEDAYTQTNVPFQSISIEHTHKRAHANKVH